MCSASSTSWARTASMPTPMRYSAAAPSPTASAIGGVPASNFQGRSAQVLPSVVTLEIISPPPRKGPIASRIAGVPTRQPMPVGPSILWPVNAKKSQPMRRDVDRHVGDALRAVDQAEGAVLVGQAGDLGDRVDRAEHVAGVDHADHAGPLGQEPAEGVHVELAAGRDRGEARPWRR